MSTWDADELVLYTDNDYELYRQKDAFLANVHRKMKAGRYDVEQGKKLWMYYVDRAAKKYAREFGGVWNKMFPKSERLKAAAHYEREERHLIERGEYEKYPPTRTLHDPSPRRRKATTHRHHRPGAPTFAQQKTIARKVRILRREGYPEKQAVAIAYRTAGVRPRKTRRS